MWEDSGLVKGDLPMSKATLANFIATRCSAKSTIFGA